MVWEWLVAFVLAYFVGTLVWIAYDSSYGQEKRRRKP